MIDEYQTLAGWSEGFLKERNSKFYGYAFPAVNRDEQEHQIEKIREKHSDARHHCYAWQLGIEQPEQKVNDAGEPHNSAGVPILNAIKSAEITNCGIVVVRYFGGVKLGVGGLVSAYHEGAKLAIEQGKIVTRFLTTRFRIQFKYEQTSQINQLLHSIDHHIVEQSFEADVKQVVDIRLTLVKQFKSQISQWPSIKLSEL